MTENTYFALARRRPLDTDFVPTPELAAARVPRCRGSRATNPGSLAARASTSGFGNPSGCRRPAPRDAALALRSRVVERDVVPFGGHRCAMAGTAAPAAPLAKPKPTRGPIPLSMRLSSSSVGRPLTWGRSKVGQIQGMDNAPFFLTRLFVDRRIIACQHEERDRLM